MSSRIFSVSGDKIWLKGSIFSAINGSLDADEFCTGSTAQDGTDRIVYDAGSGALFYDADGSGAALAVRIATLDASLGLTAGHFLMI